MSYSLVIKTKDGRLHYCGYPGSSASEAIAAAWKDWPDASTIYEKSKGISIPIIRSLFGKR